MFNPILNRLPNTADFAPDYPINVDFRIGVQIALAMEDTEITDEERAGVLLALLFQNQDGSYKKIPDDQDVIIGLATWLLNGWCNDEATTHENQTEAVTGEKAVKHKRYLDYNIDSWRIYADFLGVYGLDLNTIDGLHYWAFCNLLWNMPFKQSSFLQVVDIRQRNVNDKMSKEEQKEIKKAQKRYALEPLEIYTEEQTAKIDEYDRIKREREERLRSAQKEE